MNIEITGETEKLIQAAVESGRFASAEELIADMAKGLRSVESDTKLPEHAEVDSLARAQGIGPLRDFRDLGAEFWPEGESVDAFVNEIREMRAQDLPRAP